VFIVPIDCIDLVVSSYEDDECEAVADFKIRIFKNEYRRMYQRSRITIEERSKRLTKG